MAHSLETILTLTEGQVELMTGAQLTQTYNTLAAYCNVSFIKKFDTRAAGIKRVLPMITLVANQMKSDAAKAEAAATKQAKAAAKQTKVSVPKDVLDAAPVEKLQGPKKTTKAAARTTVTVSARARALILEGFVNSKVWEVLQAEFGLPDSKKHYPAWYRAEMKRNGQLAV